MAPALQRRARARHRNDSHAAGRWSPGAPRADPGTRAGRPRTAPVNRPSPPRWATGPSSAPAWSACDRGAPEGGKARHRPSGASRAAGPGTSPRHAPCPAGSRRKRPAAAIRWWRGSRSHPCRRPVSVLGEGSAKLRHFPGTGQGHANSGADGHRSRPFCDFESTSCTVWRHGRHLEFRLRQHTESPARDHRASRAANANGCRAHQVPGAAAAA